LYLFPKKICLESPKKSHDSWPSYEQSSTPSILSIENEVIHPSEIDVAVNRMTNVYESKLARTKQTMHLKIVPKLMPDGLT